MHPRLTSASVDRIGALLIWTLLLCASHGHAQAGTLDTLSAFKKGSQFRYYRIAGLDAQAARFELRRPGNLIRIACTFAGSADTGSARVRVFGNEAGAPTPFLEKDLVAPMLVRKTRSGVERVEILLTTPLPISSQQFFISIDQLSPGVLLICDAANRPPRCQSSIDQFTDQCLKLVNNSWWTAPRGFAIEAILDYTADPYPTHFEDRTEEVGLAEIAIAPGSLAAADADNDGYLDLLVAGRLFRNIRGAGFREVTVESGLSGKPIASVFVDVNNDKRLDVLCFGIADSSYHLNSALFLAVDSASYRYQPLALPQLLHPTSISIADVDGNTFPDLFIGQGSNDSSASSAGFLLLNDGKLGFIDRSNVLQSGADNQHPAQGSQWVDVDSDGLFDLYVARQGPNRCELWKNNGDGTFSNVIANSFLRPDEMRSVNSLGAHWKDFDSDGRIDLVAAQHTSLSATSGHTGQIRNVVHAQELARSGSTGAVEAVTIEFAEYRGAASWADVDNNGALDLFFSSGSPCRQADLFLQRPAGTFENYTPQAGLLRLRMGPDVLWGDFDNDGRVDLVGFVDSTLVYYQNASEQVGAYLALDIRDGMPGTRVTVFAEDRIYSDEVTSGRGLLIQDPPRLHVGLGSETSIDSVVIRWPDGATETKYDVKLNSRQTFGRAAPLIAGSAQVLSTVRVYPNPFSEKLEFAYRIGAASRVRIEIFGADGRLIATPLDQHQNPGVHSIAWYALDAMGNRISQGTYVYRVTAGAEQAVGKVVLSQ